MAWLTYSGVDSRWPDWENFSPGSLTTAGEKQTWLTTYLGDAQAELHDYIPAEYDDDADATPTPTSLVSACYYETRAKVLEFFCSTTGRGSQENIDMLHTRAKTIVENWVQSMKEADERGGLSFKRVRRKDPFWEADQNEGVEADYEL